VGQQREGAARLYRWDHEVVHPHDADIKAALVARLFGVGIGYAIRRYVLPFVAVDLVEW
jgi:hypothetical protein